MRQKIVAGNWKMNTTVPQGVALAQEVAELGKDLKESVKVDVVHQHDSDHRCKSREAPFAFIP